VRREEIEAYVTERGLSYVEDSSNRKDVYLRNRVRRHLIPMLEGYNPNLKTGLGRMGQVLLQEDQYMRARAQEVWRRIGRWDGDGVSVDLTEFRNIHPALQFRLLMQSVESVSGMSAKGLGVIHILSLAELAAGGRPHGVIHLPGRIIARRIYDRLRIGKEERPSSPGFDYAVTFPGITPIRELGKMLVIESVDQWNWREASSQRVFVDSQRLHPPLRVRNYRHGDRFRPLGMTGSKKIKDCFIDWKVPMQERTQVPLILSGDTIVWVVGHRISQDVRVTGDTKEVIHMEVLNL